MARLRETLENRVDGLLYLPDFRCRCVKCNAVKAAIEHIICDVNRLYTNVNTDEVLRAASAHLARYQECTDRSEVTVMRTQKVHGYAGGNIYNRGASVTFTLQEAYDLLVFGTMCRIFWVGDTLIQQVLGIPMGGHLSKIMVSILLCSYERDLFTDRSWLKANGFYPNAFAIRNIHPTSLFHGIRHVDDALIFSRVFCSSCLLKLMHHAYKAPLEVSLEGSGPRAEFLDTVVTRQGTKLRLRLFQKNELWALRQSDTIVKHNLPPVLGKPCITMRRVTAYLSVKFHRIHQLHPWGDPARLQCVVVLALEIHRLGYSLPFMRRAANRLRHKNICDMAHAFVPIFSYMTNRPSVESSVPPFR